jgi:hypothetical protein
VIHQFDQFSIPKEILQTGRSVGFYLNIQNNPSLKSFPVATNVFIVILIFPLFFPSSALRQFRP